MGHCFVRFNLALTKFQKFMLSSVPGGHVVGEGGLLHGPTLGRLLSVGLIPGAIRMHCGPGGP